LTLHIAGLFAGIGGIELGLKAAGCTTTLLCEIEPGAQAVLRTHLPEVPLHPDITSLRSLPKVDAVVGGFPCQDLSQAGLTAGIGGTRSGLVDHVFRLLEQQPKLTWLVLENVPFMLQLQSGRAMRHLTERLEQLGFRWAYRVVDARSFGLPQRRRRVILIASRIEDPRRVLFAEDAGPPPVGDHEKLACGFYWTEGVRGLGWAVDAVPTLKGGSTIGIASPPAIRLTKGQGIVTPGIADAERLQGFPEGWTEPSLTLPGVRKGHRWKLVGNAVSVPVAAWVGRSLLNVGTEPGIDLGPVDEGRSFPTAAWGEAGRTPTRVDISEWPVRHPYQHLAAFLMAAEPLSARASAGFLKRAAAGNLRFVDGFLDDVRDHLARVTVEQLVLAS
jgi:DNA (cytosine-5)-methyltransferase 1